MQLKEKATHKYSNSSNEENSIKLNEKKSDSISYIIIHKINYIIKFNLIVNNSTQEEYNVKVVNDIIYNEDKRIVSKFKDHLIYNDPAEFLRRFYEYEESSEIITQWGSFFQEESLIKLVPNYSIITTKKYLLKNIRKKLKLREKLRKSYYDESEENEENFKNNKPIYSKFFYSNIDLKDSILEKSSLDLNFNLIDDADKSRFYNCNNKNYFLINGATKFLNENIIRKKIKNKNQENNNYFRDNEGKFIVTNSKRNKYHFILNKYLSKYDINNKEIPSMSIDSNCKFFNNSSIDNSILNSGKNETFLMDNISNLTYPYSDNFLKFDLINSGKKISDFLDNSKNAQKICEGNSSNNNKKEKEFFNTKIYENFYDENTKQNIVKLREKESEEKFLNKKIDVNEIQSKISDNSFNNLKKENFYENLISKESLNLQDDVNYDSRMLEEDTENNQYVVRRESADLRNSIRKESLTKEIFQMKKFEKENDTNKKDSFDKDKYLTSTLEAKNENSEDNKTKRKSLGRNTSTKNLLFDYKKTKESLETIKNSEKNETISQKSPFKKEKNLNINTIKDEKDSENNYFNLQTKKSLKKTNPKKLNISKQRIYDMSLARYNNNKNKKDPRLNRNISDRSPNAKSINKNSISKEKNWNLYCESKLYKENKQKNLENKKNLWKKNKENIKDKINNKDNKDNKPRQTFNLKKNISGILNRVQSVQNLQSGNIKIKIGKFECDSKEKNESKIKSNSLVKKNAYSKKLKKNEANANTNNIAIANSITILNSINSASAKKENNLILDSYSNNKKNNNLIKNKENSFANRYRMSNNSTKNLIIKGESKTNSLKNSSTKSINKHKTTSILQSTKGFSKENLYNQNSKSLKKFTKTTKSQQEIKNEENLHKKINKNSKSANNLDRNIKFINENSNLNISSNENNSNQLTNSLSGLRNNKNKKNNLNTPSPINKTKNKFAIAAENLMMNLNNNKNLRDSKKIKSRSNLKKIDKNNNDNDDSYNNISIVDNRNINFKENLKKNLNVSKSNYQYNNNNNMVYLNVNSKEENEEIRKESKEEFILENKNNINLDYDIPVFESIEMKKKSLKENSKNFNEDKNIESFSLNKNEKIFNNNLILEENEIKNEKEIPTKFPNPLIDTRNYSHSSINFNNLNKQKFVNTIKSEKNLSKNIQDNEKEINFADENKIEIDSNKELNTITYIEKEVEIKKMDTISNQIKEKNNFLLYSEINIENINNSNNYKINDKVHLNKFLNNRINNNTINPNDKIKNTNATFSVFNQENIKVILNENNSYKDLNTDKENSGNYEGRDIRKNSEQKKENKITKVDSKNRVNENSSIENDVSTQYLKNSTTSINAYTNNDGSDLRSNGSIGIKYINQNKNYINNKYSQSKIDNSNSNNSLKLSKSPNSSKNINPVSFSNLNSIKKEVTENSNNYTQNKNLNIDVLSNFNNSINYKNSKLIEIGIVEKVNFSPNFNMQKKENLNKISENANNNYDKEITYSPCNANNAKNFLANSSKDKNTKGHRHIKSTDFNTDREKQNNILLNSQKNIYPKNTFINNKPANSSKNKDIQKLKSPTSKLLTTKHFNEPAVAINPENNKNTKQDFNKKNLNNELINKEKNNILENKKIYLNNININNNPKHKKNSYSHAFISCGGNKNIQNSHLVNNNNQIGNAASNNLLNFKNKNSQARIKLTPNNKDSKEKEKIILNFSSNNSSNMYMNNNNITTKNNSLNDYNNYQIRDKEYSDKEKNSFSHQSMGNKRNKSVESKNKK